MLLPPSQYDPEHYNEDDDETERHVDRHGKREIRAADSKHCRGRECYQPKETTVHIEPRIREINSATLDGAARRQHRNGHNDHVADETHVVH